MNGKENVLTGDQVAVAQNPTELLAQLGQMAKDMATVNPSMAKQLSKQAERMEKLMAKTQDVVVPYDEEKVETALNTIHSEYQDAGAEHTEIIMIRGGDVRRMRINRENMYVTPTGLKKILFPARETSAGKNPQALAFEFNTDGTFTLEPSHAGVDWKDHIQNRWK